MYKYINTCNIFCTVTIKLSVNFPSLSYVFVIHFRFVTDISPATMFMGIFTGAQGIRAAGSTSDHSHEPQNSRSARRILCIFIFLVTTRWASQKSAKYLCESGASLREEINGKKVSFYRGFASGKKFLEIAKMFIANFPIGKISWEFLGEFFSGLFCPLSPIEKIDFVRVRGFLRLSISGPEPLGNYESRSNFS